MTQEQMAALRVLAEQATPGEWVSEPDVRQDYSPHSQTYSGEEYVSGYNIKSNGTEIVGVEGILADGKDNAAYIAAANPAAVLALMDENARLREFYEAQRAIDHDGILHAPMEAWERIEAARATLESRA